MRPSDIRAPFEQASSSPWAVWISHESEIPTNIDLGDPRTFWWTELEEEERKACRSEDDDWEEGLSSNSTSKSVGRWGCVLFRHGLTMVTGKQRCFPPVNKAGPSACQPSKRYRADPPSDEEEEGLYIYVPVSPNSSGECTLIAFCLGVCQLQRPPQGMSCRPTRTCLHVVQGPKNAVLSSRGKHSCQTKQYFFLDTHEKETPGDRKIEIRH